MDKGIKIMKLKRSENRTALRLAIIGLLMTCVGVLTMSAQNKKQVVDKVVAVVGNKIVLESDVQSQYAQYVSQGMNITNTTRCDIMESMLFEKLLLVQAEKDSITVSDDQVDAELTRRINYYISQFGSKKKFEDFYGKTVDQFKEELRGNVKDMMLEQKERSQITSDITVSPEEVKDYFNNIPADSVPYINAEVQIAQIEKKPPITKAEDAAAKEKLEKIRTRIMNGEDFATMAILYSDDPGSAKNGGEYKNVQRGQFVPAFDAVAFSLKQGQISKVFKTQYGYHIVQLIKRRGEYVDVRHILIAPKVSPDDLLKAENELDSIRTAIMNDSISFAMAAGKFSDDKDTKFNGGLMQDPQTGSNELEMDQLGKIDPSLVFTINNMKVGDVSKPIPMSTSDGKEAYRIIKLESRTKPHKANLKQDYQQIQAAALAKKQRKVLNKWVNEKLKSTYVKIDPEYDNCKFDNNWLSVNQP